MNENLKKDITVVLFALLFIFAGVVATVNCIDAGRTRAELDGLRRDYNELEGRNSELEARDRVRQELVVYINTEAGRADTELANAIKRAGSGIAGLEATVRALQKWGGEHKSIEREIISRLESSAP